jgi:hypothetical protein
MPTARILEKALLEAFMFMKVIWLFEGLAKRALGERRTRTPTSGSTSAANYPLALRISTNSLKSGCVLTDSSYEFRRSVSMARLVAPTNAMGHSMPWRFTIRPQCRISCLNLRT